MTVHTYKPGISKHWLSTFMITLLYKMIVYLSWIRTDCISAADLLNPSAIYFSLKTPGAFILSFCSNQEQNVEFDRFGIIYCLD